MANHATPAPDAQPAPRMRIKVACINWSHTDAPHALVYGLVNGEMRGETYFDRWADAIKWASMMGGAA